MYLKSIEVHGFKSFANKITFRFHNGITCIVGPNGSGKSNVADAVRWVLGEQRIKQLRGASMQDVIFSGTQMRKPMGYAYVSITLDNADHKLPVDFEEITVSRRVYRSGESEYLINGVTCRLRDVYEMFYDTGIGKEGYSIIGQGQIDKILSGKPEERRELFDEAAGIVKFKRRKSTAIKKLEEERTNLVRVSDILSELEKQTEPLKKQSEVAREYLKEKEELKKLDVNMFLLETERVKRQLSELDEKFKIADGDLGSKREKYEAIKDEYTGIETKIGDLDLRIEENRKLLSDSSLLKEKLEGEIKVLKEKINSAQNDSKHYSERKGILEAEIKAREKEQSEIGEEKSKLDNQLNDLLKIRDKAKELLSSLQKKIEKLNICAEQDKNNIIGALNERATIKTKLGRYDTMLEQSNIRRAELQSRLLRAKSEEAEQEDVMKKLYEELNEISQDILKSDEERQKLDEQLTRSKKSLEEKDKQLEDCQIEYHKEKSRLEALKNITERYDGYGSSIRSVMEQKDSIKGLIGVVADIISVEKKYETAIETALGSNIQNIVTADEQVAREMIRYLKENKFGRATFLPLTSVRARGEFGRPEIREEKGFIGMASELVAADKKYADIVSQLLGAIIVVDHIDHALQIARKNNYLLRIVTLDGEYLTPGGALSGGAFKNAGNLLSRRREIEELEESIRKSMKKADEISNAIEALKEERTAVKNQMEQLKTRQQEQYLQQNTAQMNVDQAVKKKEETINGHKELEIENREIEQQIIDIGNSKNEIKHDLEQSEQKEKDLEQQIAGYGKELETLRDEESRQVLQVTDLDLEAEKFKQKQEFFQQNCSRIEAEISRLNGETEEISKKLALAEEDIVGKQENITQIEETINASVLTTDGHSEALKQAVAEKEAFVLKQKGFFTEREKLSDEIASLDKEVFRLNSQKERVEEAQEAQISYMWSEYEITLSAAASMRDEELTDTSSIRKNILRLKDKIRGLGDVNVNAIEDYKNLMERYEFLKNQHDDLVKAEQTLTGIIDELDAAMRKQFEIKFKEIGREFDSVFKEMFGGGKGTLELSEDEDILEAGIRIIAQPPGKRLQNMMQLSGGEKALTAIALLFAIQNLKPSPFCMLDEIEAALDESNVGRFAGYLHKLTKHTQFIVITHRRGTMEKADRLYGITMQEKGVSALVSVNLIDKDLDD